MKIEEKVLFFDGERFRSASDQIVEHLTHGYIYNNNTEKVNLDIINMTFNSINKKNEKS